MCKWHFLCRCPSRLLCSTDSGAPNSRRHFRVFDKIVLSVFAAIVMQMSVSSIDGGRGAKVAEAVY